MLRFALHMLAFLFSVFFALWGVLGVAGLFWAASMWGNSEDYNQSLIPVFLILSGCMVATGVYGLWYMRYKETKELVLDESLAWLRHRSPASNVVVGLLSVTLGLILTARSVSIGLKSGGTILIWYGAVLYGSAQAAYGAYQVVQERRVEKLRSPQVDAEDQSP